MFYAEGKIDVGVNDQDHKFMETHEDVTINDDDLTESKLLEQRETLAKGLSGVFKGYSKGLHYASRAASKANMKDAEKHLLRKRDETYEFARRLKTNAHPEDIKAALMKVRNGVAATVLVGLILSFIYKKYKRDWSAAGRYCKGTSGSQRTACLRRYKVKVLKESLDKLNRYRDLCNKSRNPEKCKEKLDVKINKLKERIHILQTIEERRQDKSK